MDNGSERFDGLAGTVYDLYIKAPPLAHVAGRLAWGLDAGAMYAHMRSGVRAAAAAAVALDVPCGGGTEFRWLRPDDPVRFIAVDGASHMVERARRYAWRRGLRNVELHKADVTALPLASGAAGVALVYNGIHHFSDPAGALSEVARCTERGGRVFGVTFVFGEHRRADRILRSARRTGSLGPSGTRADVEAWLCGAGFVVTKASTSGALLMFEGPLD